MTYESALATTRELLEADAAFYCVPASLDSILQHTTIAKEDYLKFIDAYVLFWTRAQILI